MYIQRIKEKVVKGNIKRLNLFIQNVEKKNNNNNNNNNVWYNKYDDIKQREESKDKK